MRNFNRYKALIFSIVSNLSIIAITLYFYGKGAFGSPIIPSNYLVKAIIEGALFHPTTIVILGIICWYIFKNKRYFEKIKTIDVDQNKKIVYGITITSLLLLLVIYNFSRDYFPTAILFFIILESYIFAYTISTWLFRLESLKDVEK